MTREQELERMKTLTEREKVYYQMMKAKSGVLYITAKPGVAKSAIARSIAEKMGMQYMDVRLSMVDETDVGLFPSKTTKEVGEGDNKITKEFLDHVVPVWAWKANQKPTLIHFEELNRASLAVRNAALQLLLERGIGTEFKFNENVIMLASGNLGEEDGTDVEEFDSALNNRLIHYEHTLGVDEWLANFAKENVHPDIYSYIKAYPDKLYVNPTDSCDAYATPRSWTFLSDFIVENYGEFETDGNGKRDISKWGDVRQYVNSLQLVGRSYIGDTIQGFVRFCEDRIKLTIWDIINNYDDVKDQLEDFTRDRKSEMLTSLKEIDIDEFDKKQLKNAISFLKLLHPDERTGYLLHILDHKDVDHPNTKGMMLAFKDDLLKIKSLNSPDED